MVIQNCKDLIPIPEGIEFTMGDLVLKYVEVTNQYYLCKRAALNIQIQEEGKKEP